MNDWENKNYDFDFLETEKTTEEPEEKKLNIVRLLLLIFILALLVGGAIYYFSRDNEDTETAKPETEQPAQQEETLEKQTDSLTSVQEQEKNMTEESSNTEQTTGENDTTEDTSGKTETTTNSNKEEKPSTVLNTGDLKYFIVAGAFSNRENANRKVENLKQDGYNALIAGQNANGLFIVAYDGFSGIQEAKNKLTEVRKQDSLAWIYKK